MRKQHPSTATLHWLAHLMFGLLLILSTLITSPPAQARFLTPDTWDPMLPGVDINRYAYSGNDPVNQSDPTGHSTDGYWNAGPIPAYDLPIPLDPAINGMSSYLNGPLNYLSELGSAVGPYGPSITGLGLAVEQSGMPVGVAPGALTAATGRAVSAIGKVSSGMRMRSFLNRLENAKFAQINFSEKLSDEGSKIYSSLGAGKISSVDDLAKALSSGRIDAAKVPVDFYRYKGTDYIMNTRTAEALTRAGVPKKNWSWRDQTGDGDALQRLLGQLRKNNLSPGQGVGTPKPKDGTATPTKYCGNWKGGC